MEEQIQRCETNRVTGRQIETDFMRWTSAGISGEDPRPERDQQILGKDRWPRRRAWVCVGLALFGAVATFLIYLLLDGPVWQWLLAHPNTWHEHNGVNAFRQLGKAYVPIWLTLLWSCLTNHWRTTVVALLALALVGLSVCPLKILTARRRPNDPALLSGYASSSDSHGSWQEKVSFPSGDAAAAIAVATVLVVSIRRSWAVLFLVGAGAVGLLRITALTHYPSDVFAGTIIGVFAGWWSVHWTKRWFTDRVIEIGGQWRILLGVLLAVVVPLLSPLVGMKPLLVFLRYYGAAVVGLLLIGALVCRNGQRLSTCSLSHKAHAAQAPADRQLADRP